MRWSIEEGIKKRALYGPEARPWSTSELELQRSEPRLSPALWALRSAYVRLSTCRGVGMVPGPIPWTAIEDWCRIKRMTRQQANFFASVIEHVDATYLRRLSAERDE